MAMKLPTQAYAPVGSAVALVAQTQEEREAAERARQRRLALTGQNAVLKERYDEIMNWVDPPWDSINRRADPRVEMATAKREGRPKPHVDWVHGGVTRWGVLQMGAAPRIRVDPVYVPPFLEPDPDVTSPEDIDLAKREDQLDRKEATDQAAQMEQQTAEWAEASDLHRTFLWAAIAKEMFGKAILKDSWDDDAKHPTVELMENPAQCYYTWTSRFGKRRLAWMVVADQMTPDEAEFRFRVPIPRLASKPDRIDYGRWAGSTPDDNQLTQADDQMDEDSRYVWVEESWELDRDPETREISCRMWFIIAGRVLQSMEYPWTRLPFKVWENAHVPTRSHGKSTAELIIPINAMYDDLLDLQHTVIETQSGPSYQGLNMAPSDDEALQIPDPGHIMRLREGEEIRQIESRVDFYPGQVHAEELRSAFHWATALTPIALGMSPAAQTSGRALSAEWRSVELFLAQKLVDLTPEIRDIISSWWDYAEAYWPKAAKVAKGHRRFKVIWEPLDIRDTNERILAIIQMVQADLMDPESAIEEAGYEDVPERIERIRTYLTDPVWNPLRYQQMLVLRQLALQIEQQEMQNAAMRSQAPQGGAPGEEPPQGEDVAAQGEMAAALAAQGPAGPVDQSMNQPGMSPAGGGLPLETSILSRSPMEQGIGVGNQIMVNPGAAGGGTPPPTAGYVPR